MKRFALLILSFGVALSLAGCTIIIGGSDGDSRFDNATEVSVSENFDTPARQDFVGVNETIFYRVNLSGSAATNSDLVIIEASAEGDGDALEVAVYDEDREALLASVSPDYFGSPDAVDTSALSPQQLTTSNCQGPCVAIRPSTEDIVYVSVRSLGGVEDYSLFVVAADFADTTEPNNSNREPAILGEEQLAAIEYVGDEDFIQSPNDVTQVSLSAVPPQLDLEFDVYTESGRYLDTGSTDATYTLPADQPAQQLIISVTSESNRAAVGGSANYGVTFE